MGKLRGTHRFLVGEHHLRHMCGKRIILKWILKRMCDFESDLGWEYMAGFCEYGNEISG
jgi:hypothetical protein